MAAILDVLAIFNLVSEQKALEYKSDLGKCYAMISNL